MNNDKRILCYYIISFVGGLTDFDMARMTDDDIMKEVEKLDKFSYEDLLSMYEFLNNMFIEKFGFNEEEF